MRRLTGRQRALLALLEGAPCCWHALAEWMGVAVRTVQMMQRQMAGRAGAVEGWWPVTGRRCVCPAAQEARRRVVAAREAERQQVRVSSQTEMHGPPSPPVAPVGLEDAPYLGVIG